MEEGFNYEQLGDQELVERYAVLNARVQTLEYAINAQTKSCPLREQVRRAEQLRTATAQRKAAQAELQKRGLACANCGELLACRDFQIEGRPYCGECYEFLGEDV